MWRGGCAVSAPRYVEVGGIEWCTVHSGVVDECANVKDVDGTTACDMYDPCDGACDIVQLFYKEQQP